MTTYFEVTLVNGDKKESQIFFEKTHDDEKINRNNLYTQANNYFKKLCEEQKGKADIVEFYEVDNETGDKRKFVEEKLN